MAIENFTPVSAAIGGCLIGLGAVMLMAANGRIAGISGILFGLFPDHPASGKQWRLAFLLGIAAGPFLAWPLSGGRPAIEIAASDVAVIAAGLLVGAGTVLGSGCTSGHGVCGIARLSPRSIAATAVFVAIAIGVVFVTRHVV